MYQEDLTLRNPTMYLYFLVIIAFALPFASQIPFPYVRHVNMLVYRCRTQQFWRLLLENRAPCESFSPWSAYTFKLALCLHLAFWLFSPTGHQPDASQANGCGSWYVLLRPYHTFCLVAIVQVDIMTNLDSAYFQKLHTLWLCRYVWRKFSLLLQFGFLEGASSLG